MLDFSDDRIIQALFAHGQQQAHLLLGYVPSYHGYLHRGTTPRASNRRRRERAVLPDEDLEQLWGRERQPRNEMAAATERPSLAQLRQQQQRERRGRARRAGRGASQRRVREEQPEDESDPASKRLRVDETTAPPSPPRSTEEAAGITGQGVPASVAGGAETHTPEGQLQPRGPGRTLTTANRESGGGSDISPPEVWAPIYAGRGGVRLTTADSVRANPDVANVLLKGLALPADMSAMDALSLDDNFVELHSCLVKVRIVSC